MAFYRTEKLKNYRNSTEILELIAAFERGTLPLSEWHRPTLLTLAFWYLYLNPPAEAGRLIGESLARYRFENGLGSDDFTVPEKTELAGLLAAISDQIRIYKSTRSFVALANLVLRRFAAENPPLKIYRRRGALFPDPGNQPRRPEATR
jgi:hypothetical protein